MGRSKSAWLSLILVAATAAGCTPDSNDDDDDVAGDGDADADADADADGDADADADADTDADADGDTDADADGDGDCVFEADDDSCADGIDNDANGHLDCRDFCCRRNPAVQVCTVPSTVQDVRQGVVEEYTRVSLEGLVVTSVEAGGWTMQDPTAEDPSYSCLYAFVPAGNPADITLPAVGDIVNVVGELQDFYGLAELSWILASPEVVSSDNALPTPVVGTPEELGDEDGTEGALAEAMESCLVDVTGVVSNLAPTPGMGDQEPTNELVIGADDSTEELRIDDRMYLVDPWPEVGDTLRVIGPLRMGNDHFKVEPRSAEDVTR